MVNSEDNTANTPAPAAGVVRPPLPRWTVPAVAAVVLAVTALASLLLWTWVNGLQLPQDRRVTAMLEVFKLTASVAVGGGGLFALYLAARRQRTQELELAQREKVQAHAEQVAQDTRAHAERVAEATERDAAERRITELYTKASDQLGSDKAAVRLAGLYALERLGQNTPDQQEAVGNLLCAYLRMPHPRPHPLPEGPTPEQSEAHELAQALYDQERETRQTALDILTRHHSTARQRWPKLSIRLHRADLGGADLINANLTEVNLSNADLTNANLTDAILDGAYLRGANLSNAIFIGADLTDAYLIGAILTGACFTNANLIGACFTNADLTGASFGGANLTNADLGDADLIGARFTNSNLTGADLGNSNLAGADFRDAILAGTILVGTTRDDETVVTDVIVDGKTQGMWW